MEIFAEFSHVVMFAKILFRNHCCQFCLPFSFLCSCLGKIASGALSLSVRMCLSMSFLSSTVGRFLCVSFANQCVCYRCETLNLSRRELLVSKKFLLVKNVCMLFFPYVCWLFHRISFHLELVHACLSLSLTFNLFHKCLSLCSVLCVCFLFVIRLFI